MAFRRRALIALGLVACVSSLAAGAGAQSLAEAARLAEQQRVANAGKTTVVKPPAEPDDGEGPRLTGRLVYVYGEARIAMAVAMRQDSRLKDRMRVATFRMREYDEVETILASEPLFVSMLESFGLTPHSYLQLETTLLRIQAIESKPGRNWPDETRRFDENLAFARASGSLVSSVLRRAWEHDHDLPSWTQRYRFW